MNKTLIVAALSALAAGGALAQSSVTIYGRMNLSAERQDAAGTKTSVLSNNSSRLGFKGSEDLGGGLRAGFQLEHGFDASTGLPNASFWGRQSEVNLSGAFGTVRMGTFTSEAYFATADYISMHNHDTGSSSDALYAYVGRNTNKVAYRAPEFVKGMSLELGVSLAESVPGREKSYDLAWNYVMGALHLGAGYEENGQAKQFAVRALYEMGPLTLGAYVQRDTDGYGVNYGDRTNTRVSAAYAFGLSELHLNFGHAGSYDNVANSSADQFTVGYNYNLSKRTKVYTYYTKVSDSAAKVYGGDFNSFALGLRHNF
ncbi:MAG: porin [Rubrivivax sp.]|nr:porin [Rubrivivax sp.]